MSKPKYHVASFSGGKDSTAMVLRLIERGDPLDEVLCCDTTMEFPAMLRHIAKVQKVVESAGVKFTILRAPHDFEYYLLKHRIKRRKSDSLTDEIGYSWPGPLSRWCTRALKKQVINKYLRDLRGQFDVIQYVGLAADELHRTQRKNNQAPDLRFPLVEWGWNEAKALDFCYSRGYDWEGLYKIFNRVSCWCCPLQPLEELRKLWRHFPELWQRLRELDAQTWRNFKPNNQSIENLEQRFKFEDELISMGYSIKDRQFFTDLKRVQNGEVTTAEVLQERENLKYE